MNIEQYLRTVMDFPKEGIAFKDISPLLVNPLAFRQVVDEMSARWADYDTIAAFDARGFLFGSAMAYSTGKSLVMIRKKGKLPYDTITESYGLEYGTDTLEMHIDALGTGSRVLLVDDVLATGGTAKAGCTLVERLGGTVVGCQFLMEIPELKGRELLQGYNVHSLNVEYCADVVATYNGKVVLVERQTAPYGLALPGGRMEMGENSIECGVREFREETGLHLVVESILGTYDAPERDPRGRKISTVLTGIASGSMAHEAGKTKVVLMDVSDIEANKDRFAFDHYTILRDWMTK